jgi:hypothetical protein
VVVGSVLVGSVLVGSVAVGSVLDGWLLVGSVVLVEVVGWLLDDCVLDGAVSVEVEVEVVVVVVVVVVLVEADELAESVVASSANAAEVANGARLRAATVPTASRQAGVFFTVMVPFRRRGAVLSAEVGDPVWSGLRRT